MRAILPKAVRRASSHFSSRAILPKARRRVSPHFFSAACFSTGDTSEARLEARLEAFCARVTQGRDASHGVEHMIAVRDNAKLIFDMLAENKEDSARLAGALSVEIDEDNVRRLVIAAAQCHDIVDHKYVAQHDDLHVQVEEELRGHFSRDQTATIQRCMQAVSFSNEQSLRMESASTRDTPFDFGPFLAFSMGAQQTATLVRDIVSDADKLEAIGQVGVDRCVQYIVERNRKYTKSALYPEGIDPSQKEILRALVDHGEEKLFLLMADRYIRTVAGRKLGAPKHNEMVLAVCELLKAEGDADEAERLLRLYWEEVEEEEQHEQHEQHGHREQHEQHEQDEEVVELEPRIVAAGQVDSEGMLQGIVSDLSGSSHHPTTKEIRAWCRRTFGPSWWDVEPSVKKERKREAKAALLLQGGLSENCDDVATGSAQPSQKEIRAWCRQEFGLDWWQVGTDVKATRKSQAVKALRVEASPAPLPESTG